VGDKGALSITPNDAGGASAITLTQIVCLESSPAWADDAAIVTSLRFRPTTTEA
jgi:hypothetical protein